jgi:hypothetical protein
MLLNWSVHFEYDNFVGIKKTGTLIKSFKLFQNYPNPFNPSTNIKFQIPESKFVTLKIYDLLGREISTLVNEKLSAGEYEVPFNAENTGGINLASGVYFYRLTMDDYVSVKRMILLK